MPTGPDEFPRWLSWSEHGSPSPAVIQNIVERRMETLVSSTGRSPEEQRYAQASLAYFLEILTSHLIESLAIEYASDDREFVLAVTYGKEVVRTSLPTYSVAKHGQFYAYAESQIRTQLTEHFGKPDGGLAGVREPRRPHPPAPTQAEALDEPAE